MNLIDMYSINALDPVRCSDAVIFKSITFKLIFQNSNLGSRANATEPH